MVKVHQLVAAIATTITLSTSAYALNMGSISWKSSYGQPLDARIELSDANNIQASEIKPSLATSNDFAKAGIDYSPELSNLSFNTIVNPNGTGYIKITSKNPIKEPFINLLVDVSWPNGKVSKEYTVLLDIPAKQSITEVKSSNTKKPKTDNTPSVSSSKEAANTYKTKRGDTLWIVARENYGQALIAKASKAIFDKNPNAFINGNKDALLSNYKLSMPSTQDIKSITVADANAFLGAPSQEKTTSQKQTIANTNQNQALQNQLQNSEKDLEAIRVENTALNTELKNIETEIARLEQLSLEKDEAIKKAEQEKLIAEQAKIKAAQEEQLAKTQNIQPPVKTEPDTHSNTTKPAQTTDSGHNTPNSTIPKANEGATKQPVVTPPPSFTDEEDTSPSFISSLLEDNSMLLAGGGIILVLCIAALILRRRKAANDDTQVVDLSNVTLDDKDIEDPIATVSTPENTTASPLSQLGVGMGVLDKADIYLAYNHYDEAKELLTTALQGDPTNTELRLKLMEIYADKGDKAGFEAEEQELLLLDPLSQHKIDNLKANHSILFTDFSFSNNPASHHQDQPLSQINDFETEKKIVTPPSDEQNTDSDDFSFSTPIIAPIHKEETVKTKSNEEEISTKLLEEDMANFELDKISPNEEYTSTPLFDAEIEENFSSDSLTNIFLNEDESSEENDDNVKFDLTDDNKSSTSNIDYLSQLDSDDTLETVIEKDQVTTKLELVHAYIDMGDSEGAHDLLIEILQEGNDSQKQEAQSLLNSLDMTFSAYNATADVSNMTHQPTPNNSFNTADHTNTALTELELGFELPPDDEVSTKLELANAFIEMGDDQGARDILDEVLNEGNEEQKQKAQELLQSIS